MDREPDQRGVGTLLNDVVTHLNNLVRKELDLFRTEMSENATSAAVALGMIAGALVVALVALNVLAAALVAALAKTALGAGWSALLVGVVFAIVAFVMLQRGMAGLRATSLAPKRTARTLAEDADAIRETM